MAYLIIDGVEIKNLVSYDDLLSTQDGEDSGRNPALVMNRDILGRTGRGQQVTKAVKKP